VTKDTLYTIAPNLASKHSPICTDEDKRELSMTLYVEIIEKITLLIRRQKVILDEELAALYGVTKVPVQSVKRNIERFPNDFTFLQSYQEP
jgi:hypothetical protein